MATDDELEAMLGEIMQEKSDSGDGGEYDVLDTGGATSAFDKLSQATKDVINAVVHGLVDVRPPDEQEKLRWALFDLLNGQPNTLQVRKAFPSPHFVACLQKLLQTAIASKEAAVNSGSPILRSLSQLQYRRAVRTICQVVRTPNEGKAPIGGKDPIHLEQSDVPSLALQNELPTMTHTEKLTGFFTNMMGRLSTGKEEDEEVRFCGDDDLDRPSEPGGAVRLVSAKEVLRQEKEARKQKQREMKEETARIRAFWVSLTTVGISLFLLLQHSNWVSGLLCHLACVAYPLLQTAKIIFRGTGFKERYTTFWLLYIFLSLSTEWMQSIPSYLLLKFLLFLFLQLYDAHYTDLFLDLLLYEEDPLSQ